MSLSWRDGLESGATVLVGMKSPTQWEYLQCFALFIQIIRSQCGRDVIQSHQCVASGLSQIIIQLSNIQFVGNNLLF